MGKIVTSIHKDYQANTWTILDACRETGSNGIDAETRNQWRDSGKLTVKWSPRTKVLSVFNEGLTVSAKALLMGTSESRDDEDCIGEFGEGLPMALKVFAANGYNVVIYNGEEKWTPAIEESPQFDGEPVLVVNTRKMFKDRGGFLVEVHDIERHEYETFQGLFLKLHPEYDESEAVSRRDYSNDERVLLQECMKGKVFNKGVFVLEREDLLFGYDLDTSLNRDRSFISEYKLKEEISDILNGAVKVDPVKFANTLIDALFAGDEELELTDCYSSLQYNRVFRESVAAEFIKRFGTTAIAVKKAGDVKTAEELGLRGIVLPTTLFDILAQELGTVQQKVLDFENSTQEMVAFDSLPFSVEVSVKTAQDVILFGLPEWKPTVKVVNFGGKDVPAKRMANEEVHLAQWVAEMGVCRIVKALVTVAPKEDEDTTIDVLCRIISSQSWMF